MASRQGVGQWLDSIGMGEYKDAFKREGFEDLAVVAELTEADLDALGITKPAARKKVLMLAKELKDDDSLSEGEQREQTRVAQFLASSPQSSLRNIAKAGASSSSSSSSPNGTPSGTAAKPLLTRSPLPAAQEAKPGEKEQARGEAQVIAEGKIASLVSRMEELRREREEKIEKMKALIKSKQTRDRSRRRNQTTVHPAVSDLSESELSDNYDSDASSDLENSPMDEEQMLSYKRKIVLMERAFSFRSTKARWEAGALVLPDVRYDNQNPSSPSSSPSQSPTSSLRRGQSDSERDLIRLIQTETERQRQISEEKAKKKLEEEKEERRRQEEKEKQEEEERKRKQKALEDEEEERRLRKAAEEIVAREIAEEKKRKKQEEEEEKERERLREKEKREKEKEEKEAATNGNGEIVHKDAEKEETHEAKNKDEREAKGKEKVSDAEAEKEAAIVAITTEEKQETQEERKRREAEEEARLAAEFEAKVTSLIASMRNVVKKRRNSGDIDDEKGKEKAPPSAAEDAEKAAKEREAKLREREAREREAKAIREKIMRQERERERQEKSEKEKEKGGNDKQRKKISLRNLGLISRVISNETLKESNNSGANSPSSSSSNVDHHHTSPNVGSTSQEIDAPPRTRIRSGSWRDLVAAKVKHHRKGKVTKASTTSYHDLKKQAANDSGGPPLSPRRSRGAPKKESVRKDDVAADDSSSTTGDEDEAGQPLGSSGMSYSDVRIISETIDKFEERRLNLGEVKRDVDETAEFIGRLNLSPRSPRSQSQPAVSPRRIETRSSSQIEAVMRREALFEEKRKEEEEEEVKKDKDKETQLHSAKRKKEKKGKGKRGKKKRKQPRQRQSSSESESSDGVYFRFGSASAESPPSPNGSARGGAPSDDEIVRIRDEVARLNEEEARLYLEKFRLVGLQNEDEKNKQKALSYGWMLAPEKGKGDVAATSSPAHEEQPAGDVSGHQQETAQGENYGAMSVEDAITPREAKEEANYGPMPIDVHKLTLRAEGRGGEEEEQEEAPEREKEKEREKRAEPKGKEKENSPRGQTQDNRGVLSSPRQSPRSHYDINITIDNSANNTNANSNNNYDAMSVDNQFLNVDDLPSPPRSPSSRRKRSSSREAAGLLRYRRPRADSTGRKPVDKIFDGADTDSNTDSSKHAITPNKRLSVLMSRAWAAGGFQADAESDIWTFREISFDELELSEKIGDGQFGVVFKGRWRGATIAVKQLKLQNLNEEMINEFRYEAQLMSQMGNHPNVVRFLGICTKPPHLCLVLEFLPRGSLHDILIKQRQEVPHRSLVGMARNAAAGILHLHSEGVIHRDIASRNFLVDSNWTVKVSDFGMSRVKLASEEAGVTQSDTGPLRWMAPESLLEREYSEKSDSYSFGIFLWELIARQQPYQGARLSNVASMVLQGERPQIPSSCPAALSSLMQECWDASSAKRPNFAEIVRVLDAYYNTLAEPEQVEGALEEISPTDPLGLIMEKFVRSSPAQQIKSLVELLSGSAELFPGNEGVPLQLEHTPEALENAQEMFAKLPNNDANDPKLKRLLQIFNEIYSAREKLFLFKQANSPFVSDRLIVLLLCKMNAISTSDMLIEVIETLSLLSLSSINAQIAARFGASELVLKAMRQNLSNARIQRRACAFLSSTAKHYVTPQVVAMVLSLMRRHTTDHYVLQQACLCLEKLAFHTSGREIIATTGGIENLIEILGVHGVNRPLLQQCCRTLAVLAKEHENRMLMTKRKVVEKTTKIMSNFPYDTSIQTSCCLLLGKLAEDYDVKIFIAQRSFDKIVASIDALSADLATCQRACYALCAISPIITEKESIEKVVQLAFTCANKHDSSLKMKRQVLKLLALISSENDGRKVVALQENAASIAIEILRIPAYSALWRESLMLLCQLAKSGKGKRSIVKLGGIPWIVNAIRSSSSDRECETAMWGCGALANLYTENINKEEEKDENMEKEKPEAIRAVLDAMKKYSAFANLQEDAAKAITAFASDKAHRMMLGNNGALSLLLSSMKKHHKNKNVQEMSLCAMHNVLCLKSNKKYLDLPADLDMMKAAKDRFPTPLTIKAVENITVLVVSKERRQQSKGVPKGEKKTKEKKHKKEKEKEKPKEKKKTKKKQKSGDDSDV